MNGCAAQTLVDALPGPGIGHRLGDTWWPAQYLPLYTIHLYGHMIFFSWIVEVQQLLQNLFDDSVWIFKDRMYRFNLQIQVFFLISVAFFPMKLSHN